MKNKLRVRNKKKEMAYMYKNKISLTLITAVMISIFTLSVIIMMVLNFRGLYYFDIKYLKICENVNLEKGVVKENYNIIIDYILDKKENNLKLPSFKMSQEGQIHFKEVKGIFTGIKICMYITGIFSVLLFSINIRIKNFLFLKYISSIIMLIPLIFIALVIIDFNWLFNNLHKILFKNNYWIFDPLTDPVINILPQTFFMHELILILIILLIVSIVNYIIYIKFIGFKK